ncbi:MAG TPA: hypothetical protein VMT76_09615 [Puia sp.]|nr:hypothetical protein [Puia sp.]
MVIDQTPQKQDWPIWRRIIFRFFFIYLALNISPWTWLGDIPGISYLNDIYSKLMDQAVNFGNDHIFHVRKVLVPLNGSGDTSYGWAQVWLFLSLAVAGTLVWSLVDKKRRAYQQLNYWLCVFTRYYIALIAFVYGIEKLFALQMPFPNLSQLSTPLGDFLPMRLSWMFIGYSTPYQVFSGVMETIVGLLLLYKRTATFGTLIGTAVFLNVMMLNLCYDIPVKIFSAHIVMMCFFLLANEYDRIISFFILNKQAAACGIYHFIFSKRWMRISRIVLKIVFIAIAVGLQFYNMIQYYKSTKIDTSVKPIPIGIYDVPVFAVNKDTIPFSINDSLRWQDIIFDHFGYGSIKTSDTLFRQRYKRGYFAYAGDTASHLLRLKKMQGDSIDIVSFRYALPDSSTVLLWGKQRKDSLYIELKKSNRHFQLAEKQFHWLSEYNR